MDKVNPLDGLTAQGNLLDGLVVDETSAPPTDPDTIDRTSRLAAIQHTDILGNDVGAEMERLTEQYKGLLELYGDNQIRTEAASRQQQLQFEALSDVAANPDLTLDPDGKLAEGARVAAARVIAQGIEERKQYALEQEAIKKIQLLAQTDPTQARVRLNNLEMGDVEDVILDINTKKLVLQREIERAQIAKDAQPWFRDVTDFVLSIVPFNYSEGRIGNVDTPGLLKQWSDHLMSGARRRREASSLWNMPVEDFSRYIRDELIPNLNENTTLFGYHDRTEELNLLSNMMDTPTVGETNTWEVIDNFGWLPFTGIARSATSIPTLMVKNGARKQAAEQLARSLQVAADEGADAAAKKTGVNAEEIADAVLPSAVNPNKATSIPLTGDTLSVMERTDELIKKLPEMLPTDRFADEFEVRKAIDDVVSQLQNSFGREILDVDVIEDTLASGSIVRNLELTIGGPNGGMFPSKKAANQWLSTIGDVGYVVRDESGGWAVKITKNMPETGFYVRKVNPGQGKFLGIKADNPVFETLLNSRLISDTLLSNQAQRGTNRLSKLIKEVVEPLSKTVSTLDGASKARVEALLSLGRKEAKWFSRDELNMHYERAFKRPMSKPEYEAYNAYQEAMDLEWRLRNDDLYMQKHLRGFETGSFDTPLGSVTDQNMLVSRLMDRIPLGRVYNVERNLHHHKGNPLSQELLDIYKADGMVLVTTERAVKLSDGTYVKHFLVKGKNAKFQPLNKQQLAYRAGGHTFYEGKYYAKQARKRKQPDTLEEFLDTPKTYITGTKAEVDWWTGKMEQGRLLVKEAIDDGVVLDDTIADQLDDLFEQHPGLPSGKEFIERITKGDFELESPFVNKYDRELPDEYVGLDPDDVAFNEAESGFNGWLHSTGRMYYSGKGEDLVDWNGRMAKIVDPFESINKALTNVANLSSFADYKVSAVERWVKTYEPYLTGFKPGSSDMTKFSEAKLNTKIDGRIANKAEKQRQLIKRTIGWKTDADMKQEQMVRSIVEWINGDDPNSWRNATAEKVQNWFDNSNPVAGLRALAFDAKMGLFNPVQFPLQLSTLTISMALSPKYGLQGMQNLLFLRQYLTKTGTDHYLNELVNRGVHKMAGFDNVAEYKAFMKYTKNSGFLDIGGTHGLINSAGPSAALSQVGNKIHDGRALGRFFFNEGELWNRSVAMHIAWKETREQFKHLDYKSPDFIRRWEGRAEEYSMSMSRESQAWWQRGVLSIPTQFWAYQVRVLEAMLGNTFTPVQRLRLAAGQAFLYGSAGVPIVPWISEQIKKNNGEAPPIDSFFGAMDRGFVDTFFYNITGADMAVGKRFASGGWLTDTIKELMGLSQFGEKSFTEIAGGATGSILFKTMGDAGHILEKIIKYSVAEGGGTLEEAITKEDLVRLASNISTLGNAHKSYLVFRYGTIESGKGQTIFHGVPPVAGWEVMLFGAEPGAQQDLQAKLAYMKNKNQQVDDAAKVIEMYRVKMLNQPDKVDEYAREINIYTRMLPADIRQKAIQRVHSRLDKSLYDGVAKRADRERAKEEAIKRLQQ